MMQDISAAASLSRVYTNHCLRATVVSRLSGAGVEERHIMSVTGHKNAASLASYSRPTAEQQRSMSRLLDATTATKPTTTESETTEEEEVVPRFTDEEVQELFKDLEPQTSTLSTTATGTGTTEFDDIDTILSQSSERDLQHLETAQHPLELIPPTATTTISTQVPMLNFLNSANFSGANVTFSFNISKP